MRKVYPGHFHGYYFFQGRHAFFVVLGTTDRASPLTLLSRISPRVIPTSIRSPPVPDPYKRRIFINI